MKPDKPVIWLFLLLIFLALILIAPAKAVEKRPGFTSSVDDTLSPRYARFSRGINLPFWFWLNKGKVKPLQQRFSRDDLLLIKKLGLTFVRLPVDMANIYAPEREDRLKPEEMRLLLEGIDLIIKSGLGVNFDLHSLSQKEGQSDYSKRLQEDPSFAQEFIYFWEKLAERLSAFDPEWLVIEPMNEPVFLGEENKWPPIQAKLIEALRKKLPAETILATGALWSNLLTLLTLTPLPDPNVWYNFHFYDPHIFTHQGATWSTDWFKFLREVPYPSSPEAVRRAISLVDNEEIKKHLQQYGEERWNREKIEEEIRRAAEWAEKHEVKLFCNEFGAYRYYCRPTFREKWIKDVRTALEKYGIGWAMWEFDGSFGLVYRENKKAVVDKGIAAALGLNLNN
ncbi:MAG: glycoside hydrolase family 5 protein [Candidatus Saccharicenans sp.]